MQYESVALDQYVGNGSKWGLNGVRSHTATLTPRQTEEGLSWFKGTADAIYCNIDFLDSCDPEYVLILSSSRTFLLIDMRAGLMAKVNSRISVCLVFLAISKQSSLNAIKILVQIRRRGLLEC